MDELTAWLTLARISQLGTGDVDLLLAHFGSPTEIVRASASSLQEAGCQPQLIDLLTSPDVRAIEQDLRWLDHPSHHFLYWRGPHYPQLLAGISDPPLGLYVRGDPSILSMPQLAMVGARNPTPTGREIAHDFAARLAGCGLTITSGLAVGIDTASHQGALTRSATIAVCGTGLDVDYPRGNRHLAEQIAASGALISELPLGTPPLKGNFPRRNRIISGLALGTLVVEAAVRSGSLITARLASEQGREVFAIPGSIHNPLSHGCHRLIREGAKLVETTSDIFDELRAIAAVVQPSAFLPQIGAGCRNPEISVPLSLPASPPLDKGYEILLDALGFEPAGVDLLVVRTGLGADEVASMLLILELEGHIHSHPGGLYVRAYPRQ